MSRKHFLIMVVTLPLLCGLGRREVIAQTNNSWTAPISVQIGNNNYDLSFGVNPNATAGFDRDMDIMAAPAPPNTPYAYFALAVFPNFLQRDCRRPSNSITWNLSILNTGGASNTVSWDVSQVPSSVIALSIVSPNGTVNMLQTTSKIYVGDQSLQIILTLAPLIANAGNDASICLGASTSLNGSANGGSESYTFLWNVQSGPNTSSAQFNDATLEDPTFTPTLVGPYVLRFTVNDGASPVAFDEVTITARALPTATISGSAAICAGNSTTISAALTGTGPWNITWSDGMTQSGIASSPATRSVNPSATTTYTVTSVSDANCTGTSSGSAVVTVNPLPTASIGGDDPVISGTVHTYMASTNASNPSYHWSVTGGTINGSNTGSSISVTAGAVGTMVVSVNVTDGSTTCSKSATKNVTVNANTLAANAGNDASVCLGASTNLNGTASGGSGSYTFAWGVQSGPNTNSAQFNNPAAEDPTFTPTLAGPYVLRFTVNDGASPAAFDEVTITVKALPTVTVSGSAAICAGNSTTISAALTGAGPWNITWSDGITQSGIASSPATRSVNPSATTTYTVTFVSDVNCTGTSSGSAVVTVNPLPTASISGDDPVISGTVHTYMASTNASNPSYHWSVIGGTINGSNSGSSISVTAGEVGTMVVSVNVTDGSTTCSKSATKNVTVNANTLTANAGDDAPLCLGASINLNGTASGGSGAYIFLWNVQSGPNTSSAQFNNPATEDPIFTPTAVGSYVLRFTVNDGVVAPVFDEVMITVNALPTVSISGDDPVGAGTTHTYSASTNASNPSYNWSVTNGTINGSNTGSSISVTAGAAGTMVVSVNVTDVATTCTESTTKSVTVTGGGCTLVANAGADHSVLYALTTTLGGTPTASGGTPPYTYNWSPATAGLDNPNAANPKAKVTNTTTYTVTVTDANSCSATDQVVITVQSFVLLSDGDLKINQNKDSKGDIHSNNKIDFQPGAPGTHVGNLTAKGDITIQTKNTIQGNATAGNNLFLFGTATVTGTKQDHASVATIPVPAYSFSAGGSNITVPNNGTQTLTPGSYGEVRVKNKATLKLSAGNYYMNALNCDPNAILSINTSPTSGVNIYVVNDFQFGTSAQVKLTAGTSNEVLLVSLQSQKVNVGNNAILYGTLVLPNAQVQFLNGSQIKGAVYAASISLNPQVKFYHHTSPGAFPKEAEESEVAKSEVTGYELAQNYPNPFNPSTQIKFSVKETGALQLSIYNLYGQEIRTLISGQMNSGNHSVNWDGKDNHGQTVPSGIYLYKLRVNGLEHTRKMTFMK